MTTWFVDYEGGTDADASVGAGDSFATRRKKIDNIVATVLNPGDTIRLMGSPDPTALGQTAKWTSIDAYFANGQISTVPFTATSNTSPINVTSAGHGLVTGDTIQITSHAGNTAANGTWEVTVVDADNFTLNGSTGNGTGGSGNFLYATMRVVRLTTPVTANLAVTADGRGQLTNWTASASVTTNIQSAAGQRQGEEIQNISIQAGFTTGKAAFLAFGAPVDLSAYEQVSFWIKTNSASVPAGTLSLRLCSDVVGATTVNTIPIPALTMGNVWTPLTIDTGGPLGSSIQSIALYVDTDNGAVSVQFDNIIACKGRASPDALTLNSLISKNTAGEVWWAIQSISGTRVMVDLGGTNASAASTAQRGYYGVTETVATYKREAIPVTPVSATNTPIHVLQAAGVSGNKILVEGGWDRVDMSTQTLETWYDLLHRGVGFEPKSFSGWNKISTVRGNSGFGGPNLVATGISDVDISNANFLNMASGVFIGVRWGLDTVNFAQGGGSLSGSGAYQGQNVLRNLTCISVTGGMTIPSSSEASNIKALSVQGSGVAVNLSCTVENIVARFNGTHGVTVGSRSVVKGVVSEFNSFAGIAASSDGGVVIGGSTQGNGAGGIQPTSWRLALKDVQIAEVDEVLFPANVVNSGARVFSQNHNLTGQSVIFAEYGKMQTQTAVRHTPSGVAWAISPTNTECSQQAPLELSLAKIAVAAGALATVKGWFRRTNTGLTHRLVCKAGQLAGVGPADIVAPMTAAADTWEELTITFTPTEAGVLEIVSQTYGGTTFTGYVDDLTITQA